MLAVFCVVNAACVHDGVAQQSASPLPDPASSDEMLGAGVSYDKENGLSGFIGVPETGAPLTILPTPAAWLDTCSEVVGLRMDLGSPSREIVTRAFERYRQSVLDRRRRTWQPQFEHVNALINEWVALQQAIVEAGAPDVAPRLIAAAHRQLWRT